MPQRAPMLTIKQVENMRHPTGLSKVPWSTGDGGVPGLRLQITPSNTKSWFLRFKFRTKTRHLGLGTYPMITLAEARRKGTLAREQIAEGIDPIADRKARMAAQMAQDARMTLAQAIDGWDAGDVINFTNTKARRDWLSSVRRLKSLANVPISDITDKLLWDELSTKTPQSAGRLRGRIAEVLDWAADEEYLIGPNPANEGRLKRKLGRMAEGTAKAHYAALQGPDAARWFATVRDMDMRGSKALEFLALTAVRSGTVCGATWDEFDLDAGLWVIPAERMKTKKVHTVPLSAPAQALLAMQQREQYVFPALRGGILNDNTLRAVMQAVQKADPVGFFDGDRPAVPHGLRSTFRTWAGERLYPRELAEHALAHSFGSEVEQRYQHSTLVEARRPMMDAWAAFLEGGN